MLKKIIIAATLIGPNCEPAKKLSDDTLTGYFFGDDIKVFTLGDADTPEFHLRNTDGLTDAAECGSAPEKPTWKDWVFL